MGRTFQDRNFLVWEVYPSGGRHGFSDSPHVIFNCLTQKQIRARLADLGSDEADAQRRLGVASDRELLAMLEQASELA
ncbi:MAG TPA: hypothetical protein VMN60_08840 [Longimicrobiales bacterium]|nr:hypothetical protein [Longimicrobiales bacterium]